MALALAAFDEEYVIPVPEPNGYPFGPDSHYAAGHALLDAYLEGPFTVDFWWDPISPRDSAAGRAILMAAPGTRIAVAHAALERLAWLAAEEWRTWHGRRSHRQALEGLARALFARPLPFTRDDLAHILRVVTSTDDPRWQPWRGILNAVARYLATYELPQELRPLLERQREILTGHYLQAAYRPLTLRIDELLGEAEPGLPEVGEPWAESLLAALAVMDEARYTAWRALLAHIPATNGVKPSRAWLDGARARLAAVGQEDFERVMRDLFAVGARYVPAVLSDRNAMTLKGLVWYCGLCDDEDEELVRAVARLAVSLYALVPGVGPRSSLAAGACLRVLSEMPGSTPLICLTGIYEQAPSRAMRDGIRLLLDRASARIGLCEEDAPWIALGLPAGAPLLRVS